MPVDGLPNPRIHRICRRCGKWHHQHEGSLEYPASTGPFSWLSQSYARHVDAEASMVFICSRCHRPSTTPLWLQALIAVAVLGMIAGGGWWLWQQGVFSAWLPGSAL